MWPLDVPQAITILACVLLLEVTLGEPPNALHPVVWMGKLTQVLLRAEPKQERAAAGFVFGACLTAVVCGTSLGLYLAAQEALRAFEPPAWFEVALDSLVLGSMLSVRELWRAADHVKRGLNASIERARGELQRLCSRDPSTLREDQVIGATVESLAENTCDSFVAPLFYFTLFGVGGAVVYRAINTLDAMIGYRGRYEYTGKFAARLDDAVNYIPARLSCLMLLVAAFICRCDPLAGARMAWRDHNRTASPNAGWTMACAAGCLGVRLEKVDAYELGDPVKPLSIATIEKAQRLMLLVFVQSFVYVAAVFWFLGSAGA